MCHVGCGMPCYVDRIGGVAFDSLCLSWFCSTAVGSVGSHSSFLYCCLALENNRILARSFGRLY